MCLGMMATWPDRPERGYKARRMAYSAVWGHCREGGMTDEQQKWIRELETCSFLPGSWEKRFVRDLATFPPEKELTQRQAAALRRTAWRYRKQRGEPNMARPNDPYDEAG